MNQHRRQTIDELLPETPRKAPSLLAAAGIWLIRMYQRTLSPLLGQHCRFYPSCSEYAVLAMYQSGFWIGGIKGAWRILRCNPFGGSGVDFP
jgi:hypothetical protein